jgi:hypothetical protein
MELARNVFDASAARRDTRGRDGAPVDDKSSLPSRAHLQSYVLTNSVAVSLSIVRVRDSPPNSEKVLDAM